MLEPFVVVRRCRTSTAATDCGCHQTESLCLEPPPYRYPALRSACLCFAAFSPALCRQFLMFLAVLSEAEEPVPRSTGGQDGWGVWVQKWVSGVGDALLPALHGDRPFCSASALSRSRCALDPLLAGFGCQWFLAN